MTSEEMATLLARPIDAIIGVNRRSGGPQLTPVWFYWDGECFYFNTAKDRVKFANIKRDPQISVIIDDWQAHKYVTAYGQAEILEENIRELTFSISKKYYPPEQHEAVRNRPSDPNRVIVKLRPEKLISGG